ncbi:MAG: hypothetical protein K6G18_05175 [Treponema sp.]|nr:hypothetical protein [Treponema sp.]
MNAISASVWGHPAGICFRASAYEQENDPELRDFLSFVRNNTAESDFTRGIANMVQTKKFEQTFINEYLAWKLHDKDVELRGKKAGLAEGVRMTARNMLADKIPLEKIARYTGLSLPEVENLAARQ